MIQENRLDTDRGIFIVTERKFSGQQLFNETICLIFMATKDARRAQKTQKTLGLL